MKFFFFLTTKCLSFFKILFVYSLLVVLGLCCYLGFSAVATSRAYSSCDGQASHCFFFCRAQDVGYMGFHSCGSQALEHRLNSCGAWA